MYFSRCLKFTYHIETFIKENFQKKLNYRTQILGEHGNFNRMSLGDSLWTSIIRPSIAHGCAVYGSLPGLQFAVPSWKKYFENESELSKICSPIRIWMGSY